MRFAHFRPINIVLLQTAEVLQKSIYWMLLLLFATPNAIAAEPPNIILLMADDQGWGDVGYRGHPVLKTPHLDQMARDGLTFNRFYAAAPVCSPTRGSCLTGRHPFRYGVFFANTGHMKDQEHTLAELLHDQGYATGHFGKWHLGTLTTKIKDANRGGPGGAAHYAPPWEHGFDGCFSTESKVPTYDPLLKPKGARKTWWDPVNDDSQAVDYGTYYWTGPEERVEGDLRGDDSRLIMDHALPFIREQAKASKPFFAVIWLHAPHLPVVAGKEHTQHYADQSGYERNYFGCITALDEQVGRLRKELSDLGVEQNTMLWYAADNGPEGKAGSAPGTAGKLRGRKRDLFEGGVRVPGMLVWPAKVKPSQTTDMPAVTSDYLPTICELLDIDVGDRPIDGLSLLPLIEDEMHVRPKPIGFQSRGWQAWMEGRYKLHRRKGETLLFDIATDPGETKNIAADHPEVVKRMSRALEAWVESCEASLAGEDY